MKNYIILISGLLFFICCSNPTSETSKNAQIKDSCCIKNDSVKVPIVSNKSVITCPNCGHKKAEVMPTDVCLLSYTCEKCNTILHPKEGDCCVFCTYGDHKCPSIQEISQ